MAPHAIDSEQVTTSESGGSYGGRGGATNPATKVAARLERCPENGIKVLVVGAGVGGLMTALECWRKGLSVRVLERSAGPVYTGDNLTIQPSAMSIFRHWPELCKEIEEEQYDCWMSYYRHSGEHVYGPNPPSFNDPENTIGRKGPHVAFMQGRVKFYKALLRQMERLGIDIKYGTHVVDYYEDASAGIGGVLFDDGGKDEANLVVAADGLKSHSGKIVSGIDIRPKESGMAIYRAAYPVEHIFSEPLVRERWNYQKGERPVWEFWLGAGLHVLIVVTEDIVVWGLTHKVRYHDPGIDLLGLLRSRLQELIHILIFRLDGQDDGSATESWTPNVEPDEVLRVMEREAPGWHPAVAAIMRTAPKDSIIHWKLMWRDLCEKWTSPGGRVVQVGDSAHSFLPSSGNGASQAMEDAITLAACLQLGGRSQLSEATRVYNALRYERVSCAQKMAFVNAQIKHQTDWGAIAQNPKLIRTRFPRWIYQHDPEAYAIEKFDQALKHIVSDGNEPLQNTNFPPGHAFKKWTIEEVRKEISSGKRMEALLDGDWT
ncbi:MAG: hypothetical protein Q9222_002075 [Ikaeria aurantiellina]